MAQAGTAVQMSLQLFFDRPALEIEYHDWSSLGCENPVSRQRATITMIRILRSLTLLLLLPAAAQAEFPIVLTQCLDGTPVSVEAGEVSGQAYVNLRNFFHKTVYCAADFKSGPEQRTRRVTIKPGKNGTLTFSPNRVVTRMYVTLWCSDDEQRVRNEGEIKDSCEKTPDM